MELIKPAIGLLFWMCITFGTVFFILRKYAWGPILKMLGEREESIENSLKQAEEARKQMDSLKADNEKLLAEARAERERMLKEAREMKDTIISQAKTTADTEGKKLISLAKESIEKEKIAALAELKNKVSQLSIEMAEKILEKKFENPAEQEKLVSEHLKNIHLN